TPNVSVIDLKIVAKKATSKEEVNDAVKRASEQQLKGILAYTNDPNVSIDFNHDPHSSTFHMDQTKVMNGTLVRVMAWYDNEWGFSNRMADTAVAMGKWIYRDSRFRHTRPCTGYPRLTIVRFAKTWMV